MGATSDLTIPAPGSTTARDVLSRSLGRLLPDLLALPRAFPSRDLEAVAARARRAAADARGAAALLCALRSPTVGALIRSLRKEAGRGVGLGPARAEAAAVELAATLAFELALAGVIGGDLALARAPDRILSLGARAAIAIPAGAPITFADGRMTIARPGDPREIDLATLARGELASDLALRPYHPIAGEIVLATDDNNPRAELGAEPGEPGNRVDLGGRPIEAWTRALRDALALVEEHLPVIGAEIALYVRQFVPVGHHEEVHRSASYREAIGSIYLTLHPGPMTLAEAILHEFSHNKLHALFELDPVLEDPAVRFRSPLRADPRPLRGVLLAVHAFLPVARLYEAMEAARHPLAESRYFPERFARIRAINREGAAVVLEHARPTPVGRGLLDEIRRWIDHFDEGRWFERDLSG